MRKISSILHLTHLKILKLNDSRDLVKSDIGNFEEQND
jgi:hypothetical protein